MMRPPRRPERSRSSEGVVVALSSLVVATLIGRGLPGPQRLADVVMVYLLAVVLVSMRYGYVLSLAFAVASVLCFDFFFVPPHYTFAVDDPGHLVTFTVMLVVAIVISSLTRRREQLTQDNREARLAMETEQMRNALLSSVSHDLRTPLAVVTGAASTLLDERISPEVRIELTETILMEAESLERRLGNLLNMTRLEAGALEVRRQWQPLEEVVGTALRRTDGALSGRDVRVALPEDLRLVPIDGVLIEQVFVNLLENAAKYTPAGTPIEISARDTGDAVEVEINDRGPGVPAADAAKIFEKFQRGRPDVTGAGLGLTICRGIVGAHGGHISVTRRHGGGASFRFTIPIVGEPATLITETT
jgi:two-component system, OmpR family, sensor histidine kinase KdpD